ncbi:DUF7537 family lipoprotein [Natronobacterium gregoryi]|uniref:Lipoprotein n=2 Tax=Natronobacterium gregoryi TaxID=44930 RepID=L0AL10_NATGS|nr:hypothetical protein [Natronobacterium gregoryi]AFZ73730.1 hypothetical protein Natgr_2577 [Natronobacterium gregoryi SP2]ELY65789.1 hypothetical protein C490_13456 [Natronobacterium gregoryi SP2]PLK19455.1 hypothetical protein CYV19_14730 [Natronobacterium gregoryi SP2]SFJ47851.1 hypothetical protein SAMN05443661_1336 [Natronobacterium gregoryi]
MTRVARRRILSSSLVAGLIPVLAGCSSGSPTETEPDRPLEDVDVPGVENGRLESVPELASAHHDAVLERSATKRGTKTGPAVGPGGESETIYSEARIDGDEFFYRVTTDAGIDDRVREEYVDGLDHHVAIREGGEWAAERVGRGAGTSRTYLSGNTHLHRLDDSPRFVGTERRRDGTYYLFSHRFEGMPEFVEESHAYSLPDGGEVTDTRGRYLVDEGGLCREFETVERYGGDGIDAPHNRVVEWSLSTVGSTTVKEPWWVDEIDR